MNSFPSSNKKYLDQNMMTRYLIQEKVFHNKESLSNSLLYVNDLSSMHIKNIQQ